VFGGAENQCSTSNPKTELVLVPLRDKEITMKKLLLATAVTCAAFTAIVSTSYADTNPAMKESKYCRESGAADAICMGPEMMAMRAKMMEMTKEKAMENRSKYCRDSAGTEDPICDPKMMNDTTGY
jgi:hypothetical protein